MVELFEQDVKEFDRQSSKGNQLKWKCVFVGRNSRMFLN